MNEKVTLYNVVDIRDGRHYSIAIVSKKNSKWFIPANEWEFIED